MAGLSDLQYLPITGKQILETISFLESSEPDTKALDRSLLPPNADPTSLLAEYRFDVRSILNKYQVLTNTGNIPNDDTPIALGMITKDPTEMQSYVIARHWMNFKSKDDETVLTKADLSNLLGDWIRFHRQRVGISTKPNIGPGPSRYYDPLSGQSLSVMQAENLLFGVLKRHNNNADKIMFANNDEFNAYKLINRLTMQPTAPERTPAILQLLALQAYRGIQKSRIEAAAKSRKAIDPAKVTSKEEALRLMGDLRTQLHDVQDLIDQNKGEVFKKSENLKNLEKMRDELISNINSVGNASSSINP